MNSGNGATACLQAVLLPSSDNAVPAEQPQHCLQASSGTFPPPVNQITDPHPSEKCLS